LRELKSTPKSPTHPSHECDGRVRDPDAMNVLPTPKPTRKAEALSRPPPTICSWTLTLFFFPPLFFLHPCSSRAPLIRDRSSSPFLVFCINVVSLSTSPTDLRAWSRPSERNLHKAGIVEVYNKGVRKWATAAALQLAILKQLLQKMGKSRFALSCNNRCALPNSFSWRSSDNRKHHFRALQKVN
jgi:hypothetical protein